MDGNVRVTAVMDRTCRDKAVGRAVESVAEAFRSTCAPSHKTLMYVKGGPIAVSHC